VPLNGFPPPRARARGSITSLPGAIISAPRHGRPAGGMPLTFPTSRFPSVRAAREGAMEEDSELQGLPESLKILLEHRSRTKEIPRKIACAISGCFHCHRSLLGLLRNFDRIDEGRDFLWIGWKLTDEEKARREAVKEYALFRVKNPFPKKKKGRPKRSLIEIEDQLWLAAEVRELRKSGMSLEDARAEVAERRGISESSVRDACAAFRVQTNK
jgi:hypothetical protein